MPITAVSLERLVKIRRPVRLLATIPDKIVVESAMEAAEILPRDKEESIFPKVRIVVIVFSNAVAFNTIYVLSGRTFLIKISSL